MSRPRATPTAIARTLIGILIVVAIGATVRAIRDSAPEVRLPDIGVQVHSPDDPDIVTCERTLPDAPGQQAAIDQVEPVGLISSSEVLECPDAFDQQIVVYVGEVIGDVLARDGGAWMLVNDDAYALELGPLRGHREHSGTNSGLSVWVPSPGPELIAGRAERRGTIIRVRGRIHRADPADGGGLTLRALSGSSVTVVREAQEIQLPLHRTQAIAAALFAALAAFIFIRVRSLEQRR